MYRLNLCLQNPNSSEVMKVILQFKAKSLAFNNKVLFQTNEKNLKNYGDLVVSFL